MAKARDSGMPPKEQWETFYDPPGILDALGCKNLSSDIIELGCGYGTFTEAAAARTSSLVYALDIDPAMVAATTARVLKAGSHNVVTAHRDFVVDGFGRPEASVGFVLMFNILHIEDPVGLLRETLRALTPGGRAGVIHWKPDPASPHGPALEIRPTPEQCQVWAEEAGFRVVRHEDLCCCSWHWGMVIERPVG